MKEVYMYGINKLSDVDQSYLALLSVADLDHLGGGGGGFTVRGDILGEKFFSIQINDNLLIFYL